MLLSFALASGQTPPSFRTGAPLQLPDSGAGASESPPAGGANRQLFEAVPAYQPGIPARSLLPRASQPFPNRLQGITGAWGQVQSAAIPVSSVRRSVDARPPETPLALQRRPARNLVAPGTDRGFALRSTSESEALVQLSVGLQNTTWHTDNFSDTRRSLAVGETVMEWRPILRLEVGTPPLGGVGDSYGTEYYLGVQYAPTLHALLNAGTSRMLQSVTGEIGRASPVVLSAVRFLYDEDLFGVQGENSAEDSFTISEISPLIEYSLTPKTTLRAEGTWRQITPGDPTAGRTEYILNAGIACTTSVKTTLGIGTELGHIRFDQAAFGEQNYGQGYVSMAWQATRKIRFQTSVGAELREFDAPMPKPDRVSPVATLIVNWLPDENTRVNVGFRVRNQPSVSFRGSTFQEIRLGADAIHEMPQHFYLRGEATVTQRKYDTGARELETTIRPAVGYRTNLSRLFDSLNVEFFYHFRLIDSNQPAGDRERNLFGIESTLFF